MATNDDNGDLLGRADDVLGKADALLARHRAARLQRGPEPPLDFPLLTDVVSQTPPDVVTQPPADQVDVAALERDLRLQLLDLLGPELERLVEARVHGRVAAKVAEIMKRAGTELESEMRRAVREALAQVVQDEIARLKQG
jgi:DNA-directed RNA polymerase specialized sigma24 family protein